MVNIPKVPKITSLQFFYNVSKKKLEIKLIFLMQINIKVSCKFIWTLWALKFPTRWYYHWWAWSSILKVLKVTSLQYLYNILRKKLSYGIHFLHADKHQFLQVGIIIFDGSGQACPKYPK